MTADAYYPRADLSHGYCKVSVELPPRPRDIGPIFDDITRTAPLASFDSELHKRDYVAERYEDGTAKIPVRPEGFSDPYLYPMLTRNEKLRLTMLWYYTKDLASNEELLAKLQTKVGLLTTLIGWEFAICGVLENDVYQRLAVAGLPLAILPRRESTCSHTVQQPLGSVFFVPDMSSDWRFAQSPHVRKGGLRTYAGTQLRCQTDKGEDIALGSLCVASNSPNQTLDLFKLEMLVKFADMLTEDIVNASRQRRARQQEENDVLLRKAFLKSLRDPKDALVLEVLNQVFPEAHISVVPIEDGSVKIHTGGSSVAYSDSRTESAMWEDSQLIEDVLRASNHKTLQTTRPVRAVIGRVRNWSSDEAIVVCSSDMTFIFDDIDVRFVEGCAMVLRSIRQERALQTALMARENFMRGVTHQLRTPIHGILGSVDLLRDEVSWNKQHEPSSKTINDTANETLRMVKSSGRELMSTVNNIINFNRWAEATATTAKVATLSDLNKLESDILEEISWLLPEEQLDRISIFFSNRIPMEVDVVQIDVALLKECVQPLVLNALQNTDQGNVVISISVSPEYSSLTFDVQDTGCGIAEADSQRIFEPYDKGNSLGTGAGLGLTLARKFATTLNGTVTLESSIVGRGSHFRAKFQIAGLACSREKRRMSVTDQSNILENFTIIPCDPPSILDVPFAQFLAARGSQQSDKVTGALAVISFTHLVEQYEKLLSLAAGSLVAVSLIPAGKDLSAATKAYPGVLFRSGPFTSDRLDGIFGELSNTYTARRAANMETTGNTEVAPRKRSIESEILLHNTLSRQKSGVFRDNTPQCLLVDDNAINLRIMRIYCEKRKFPYTTALDGLQAIDEYTNAIGSTPIRLILLDLQMPNCDGIRACKEIRAIEAKESLQPAIIFIVTGQDSLSDRKNSIAAGADKFFVKPLALKSLDRSIAEIFGKVP